MHVYRAFFRTKNLLMHVYFLCFDYLLSVLTGHHGIGGYVKRQMLNIRLLLLHM